MRINRFPIKSRFFAMALVLTLATSCSGGSNSNALSGNEACQEAMRLMGKGSDVFIKMFNDSDFSVANLSTLANEFGQLIEKTDDKSLKSILVQMQSGLESMSNDDTFSEGQMVYMNEITPLTQKCYGR